MTIIEPIIMWLRDYMMKSDISGDHFVQVFDHIFLNEKVTAAYEMLFQDGCLKKKTMNAELRVRFAESVHANQRTIGFVKSQSIPLVIDVDLSKEV
jgi:hypothetical protein